MHSRSKFLENNTSKDCIVRFSGKHRITIDDTTELCKELSIYTEPMLIILRSQILLILALCFQIYSKPSSPVLPSSSCSMLIKMGGDGLCSHTTTRILDQVCGRLDYALQTGLSLLNLLPQHQSVIKLCSLFPYATLPRPT